MKPYLIKLWKVFKLMIECLIMRIDIFFTPANNFSKFKRMNDMLNDMLNEVHRELDEINF